MKKVVLNEYNRDIDYKTQGRSGISDDIFDINKGTNGYTDDILHDKEYMRDYKNVVGEIVYMSPNEYIDRCARDIFGISRESLINQRRRDKEDIAELIDIIKNGDKKLQIPDIDYHSKGQEGLHRMIAAGDVFGFDHKFPVLVIKTFDEKKELKHNIWNHLRLAIDKALGYRYTDLDDFREQLDGEIKKEFKDTKLPTDFTLSEKDEDSLVIHIGGFDFDIYREDIKFKTPEEIEDEKADTSSINLDDIDIDDEFQKMLGELSIDDLR